MKQALLFQIVFFCIFLSLNKTVSAQSNYDSTKSLIDKHAGVKHEQSIENMLNAYIEECENTKENGFSGYRVQIISSSGTDARNQVMTERGLFIKNYPSIPIYIRYNSPNFKLVVGDCRTKSDALYIRNQIKDHYPNAFVVTDNILFPKLITEQSN